MYKSLLDLYDWYMDTIEPTCPPEGGDGNRLCPVYYGKIAAGPSSNVVECFVDSKGKIRQVEKVTYDNGDYERFYLTPCCIQHRVKPTKSAPELRFFYKLGNVFSSQKEAYLEMFGSWVKYHKDHDLPGDIGIIERVLKAVEETDIDEFVGQWSEAVGTKTTDNPAIVVFTDNGDRIFEDNPDLYRSYAAFYEDWYKGIYNVEKAVSSLTGKDVEIVRKGKRPVAFGVSYMHLKKLICNVNNESTLDLAGRFAPQKMFNSYAIGVEELWKIISAFDYVSEEQRDRSFDSRVLLYFTADDYKDIPYSVFASLNADLFTIQKYGRGLRSKFPERMGSVQVAFMTWSSHVDGTSMINEFVKIPVAEFVGLWDKFNECFGELKSFCLYRLPKLMTVNDKVLNKSYKKLVYAVLREHAIPIDIERAFFHKASNPIKTGSKDQAARYGNYYKGENAKYYYLDSLRAYCGINYWNAKTRGEDVSMNLDENNENRDYLLGRAVAVYQQIEYSAMRSSASASRSTNAEKMIPAIMTRPSQGLATLMRKTNPYLVKLERTRGSYKGALNNRLLEIMDKLDACEDLDKPVDGTFLIGYYHQLSAFRKTKDADNTEETENDSVEGEEHE